MRKVLFLIIIISACLHAGVVYQTDFEDCSDSIPPGWLLYDNNGDTHYFAAENSTSAHSGSWYLRYSSSSTTIQGDDWALSDTFTLEGNQEDTLIFYVRTHIWWSSERLEVYLVKGDSPSDTVKLLWKDHDISNSAYIQKTIVFRAPETGVYRIGFYTNTPPSSTNALFVDDITVCTPDISGNNLAVDAILPYYDGWTGDHEIINDTIFTVVVKNYGNHRFNGTKTYYRIDSAGITIVPETQIGNDAINAGQTKTYTFNFTPSIYHMAEYDIYVYHNKVTDPNNTYQGDDTFHMHFIVMGHQGRDAYGWVWRDSYSVFGAPDGVNWIELKDDPDAINLNLPDEGNSFQNLASSIKFYGVNYYGINIDPNGIISFDQEPTGDDYDNDSIPSSNASAALMPFWEDLDPGSAGAVYYRTFADTLTVVEWYQVPIYGASQDSTVTFEVQIQSNLAQSNGVYDNVVFVYYDMHYDEDLMDATIGLQDSSAQNGSGKFLYYTYNEQPYIPNWKRTKGIFAIKFYSPEALSVSEIEDPGSNNRFYILYGNTLKLALFGKNEGVEVLDVIGRKINVGYMSKDNNLYIDFGNLSRGIYYVRTAKGGRFFKILKVK